MIRGLSKVHSADPFHNQLEDDTVRVIRTCPSITAAPGRHLESATATYTHISPRHSSSIFSPSSYRTILEYGLGQNPQRQATACSAFQPELRHGMVCFRSIPEKSIELIAHSILFCTPGIYLALTGLGAGGGKPSSQQVAALTNSILYGVYTVAGWCAGPVLNYLKPKYTMYVPL